MSRDDVFLLDILQESRLILQFVQGIDEAAFESDLMRQRAIIATIQIIGEASKQLSETFRTNHPEIPWRQIIGMRNVLIHDYRRIDLAEVWRVAQNDIPKLIAQIEPLVPPDEDDADGL